MKTTFMTIVALSSVLWSCKESAERTPAATPPTEKAPSAAQQQSPTGGGMMEQLRSGCPMVVDGADVAVSDTEGGVALTFTTASGAVTDLRQRVRRMARMYEMHANHAGMMWHHMGGHAMGNGMGPGPAAIRGPMPSATSTVNDTDKGSVLELRPTDPAQLDALREHVRAHQARMHTGECWMSQKATG